MAGDTVWSAVPERRSHRSEIATREGLVHLRVVLTIRNIRGHGYLFRPGMTENRNN